MKINRRVFVVAAPALLVVSVPSRAAAYPAITSYRNPGCGCCEIWVEHMRKAGFEVTMTDDPDLAGRRTTLGVPEDLAGCHTALMGDKIIEGHVPAEDVIRFLNEGGKGAGLAVPGMPMGSPGMEMVDSRDAYDVVLFDKSGGRSIFKHYPAA
jgi:hypothetical protein